MSGQSSSLVDVDSMIIPSGLVSVKGKKPVLHGGVDTDWEDSHFSKVPFWTLPELSSDQLLSIGRDWFKDINESKISTQTAIRGLKLAMSIKSMTPGRKNKLLTQQIRSDTATDSICAKIEIPALHSFSSTPFTLKSQQSIISMMDSTPAITIDSSKVVQIPAGEDTSEQEIESYCFLAFFMMRLATKSPINLVNAIKNMRSRHDAFYGPSRIVAKFTISLPQAVAYKNAIISQDLITFTFSHALANTHQYFIQGLTPQELEVLRYLGFHPFAYSGLHSYTLMMELQSFTNFALDKLLALFYCNITAPSILKIAKLISSYERTVDDPNRSILFRYCTLWGPQYFAILRSKNNSHLLYTVACTWKELNQSKENADPENIAAVSNLSNIMKSTLKKAGKIIADTLKSKMVGGAFASSALSLAIKDSSAHSDDTDEISAADMENL